MPEKPTDPFDLQTIHQLVRLMKKYDLTALDLGDGPGKIRLRRRGPESATTVTYAPAPYLPAQPAVAPPAASAAGGPEPAPSNDLVIESPMVGTYYSSPSPDAAPFVTVGSAIRPDTTVCVIEAMKVFTDIPGGVSGTVTETLVKNGQSVEFGQPLFRVRPA